MAVRTHLQEARKAKGLTQREVADALFISKDSLSRYERGEQEPGLETAMRLSRYYEVAIDKLFEIDDKHNA
ncbi:MAG: helix-turn-helix transcriptional regulator [Baileyella intestinalis]|jgi:putative transcriptional regulator|uniref:helix-turn-helix domain-containing protein n=1 Tax=Baileyella intestinalis TaxID=2606709 RepID=UPI0023F3B91D|nr:helix-turn-helix transcriptional regulator [Baileyella intestinalis]MDD5875295.1 helix-turn-helix transcriptional regulator [Baileyella intestinalis]